MGEENMNKGFTLMELLGVIVILGLLLLLLAPNLLEQLNNKKSEVSSAEMEAIKSAADLYIDEHPNNYTSGTKYICLNTLQNSGFLSSKLVEDVTKSTDYNGVKVVINNDSKTMEIVNTSSCN